MLKILMIALSSFLLSISSFAQFSCGAGTNEVYLLNDDFGTFTNENERSSWPAIQNIPYDSSGDVGNGNYAIVAECKKSGTSWAVSGYDRTSKALADAGVPYPSGTYGGMFFFNAGNTGGTYFYKKEVSVCAGTQLYFSVWYANAHPSSSVLPNVTFEIYGKDPITQLYSSTPLKTAGSGDIPKSSTGSTEWNQLWVDFSDPLIETVELRIRNNVNNNTGNDLLLDDLQIIACLPIVDLSFIDPDTNLPQTSTTINDPLVTGVTLSVDDNQLDPYKNPNPYYLLQYSLDGSFWNALDFDVVNSEWVKVTTPTISAKELTDAADIAVNVVDFCETTYLRMLVAGDANTVNKAAVGDPTAGCYSRSSDFIVRKECVAPTVTLKAYKGTNQLDLTPTPSVCKDDYIRIEATPAGGFYDVITGWKWEYTKACSACGDTWHTVPGETSSSLTIKITENTIYRATPTVKICSTASMSCTSSGVQEITINTIGAIVNNLTFDDNTYAKQIYCGDGTTITLKATAGGPFDENENSWWYKNNNVSNVWTPIPVGDWSKVHTGEWTYSETPTVTTEYKMISKSIADATGEVCNTGLETTVTKVDVQIPVISNTLTFDDGTTTKTINCGDNTQITLNGTYGNRIDPTLNKLEKLEAGETIWQIVDAPTVTPFSFSETPAKSATYRFTSYSTCGDASPAVTDVTIIVNIPPVVNTLSADKSVICGDGKDNVILTATVQGPVGTSNWEYSEDNGITWQSLLPAPNGLITTVSPVVTTEYRFISTSTCDGTTPTATTTVQANPAFVASLEIQPSADKSKIFLYWDDFTHTYTLPVRGGDIPMVAVTDIGGTNYKYEWSANVASTTDTYTVKNLTEPAIYSVAITDADGKCTSVSNDLIVGVGEIILTSILDFRSGMNNTFGKYAYNTENPLLQQPLSENLGDYKLTIFNRYGQKITATGVEGWDGKIKGKEADAGVYYYVLEYTAGGSTKQIKGSVEVIKTSK